MKPKNILFQIKGPKYWILIDPKSEDCPRISNKHLGQNDYPDSDIITINLDIRAFLIAMESAGWTIRACDNDPIKYFFKFVGSMGIKRNKKLFEIKNHMYSDIIRDYATPFMAKLNKMELRILNLLIDNFPLKIEYTDDGEIIEPSVSFYCQGEQFTIYSLNMEGISFKNQMIFIGIDKLENMKDEELLKMFKDLFQEELQKNASIIQRNLEKLKEVT